MSALVSTGCQRRQLVRAVQPGQNVRASNSMFLRGYATFPTDERADGRCTRTSAYRLPVFFRTIRRDNTEPAPPHSPSRITVGAKRAGHRQRGVSQKQSGKLYHTAHDASSLSARSAARPRMTPERLLGRQIPAPSHIIPIRLARLFSPSFPSHQPGALPSGRPGRQTPTPLRSTACARRHHPANRRPRPPDTANRLIIDNADLRNCDDPARYLPSSRRRPPATPPNPACAAPPTRSDAASG